MAGEIKINASIQVDNSNFKFPRIGSAQQTINQAIAGGALPGIVSAISTGQGTVVSAVGLATLGWVYIKNLDTVNSLEYGPLVAAVLDPFGYLKPGESAVLRLKVGTAWNVRGITATVKAQVLQFED